MITPGQKILLGLCAAHLVCVALGAGDVLRRAGLEDSWATWLLGVYTRATIHDSNYSFFSPNVDSERRIEFEIEDTDGTAIPVRLPQETWESQNRLLGSRRTMDPDTEVDELIARSLAAKVLQAYPGAARITVRLRAHDPPSMKDSLAGKSGTEQLLFSVTYTTSVGRDAEQGDDQP